jgi:hypothetical protein
VLAKLQESETVPGWGRACWPCDPRNPPHARNCEGAEGESREALLRQSDQPSTTRRNAAVEQERRIKENEQLSTEIAIEEKKRQIGETQAAADLRWRPGSRGARGADGGQIKLEADRKQLLAAQAENARTLADAEAYKTRVDPASVARLDNKVLQVLAVQTAEPRLMAAMALKQLAENAGKIGHLSITPDLLQTLLEEQKK